MMAIVGIVIYDPLDSRFEKLGSLFRKLTDVRVLFISKQGICWAPSRSPEDCIPVSAPTPERADALLVHRSDWEESMPGVATALPAGFEKTFVFNAPGDPPSQTGAIRILRSTNPFHLIVSDAKDIIRYATEVAAPLPACCISPSNPSRCIALDILCQGYRAVHGDATLPAISLLNADQIAVLKAKARSTELVEWWLAGLQVSCFSELKRRLLEEHVCVEDAESVVTTLESVTTARAASEEANDPLDKIRFIQLRLSGIVQ